MMVHGNRRHTEMKNRRLLVTAMAALLMMAGCGSKPSDNTDNSTKPSKTEPEDKDTAKDLGPLFERGVVDGQTYVNEFFGIRAEFSNEWVISTEEGLATMSQQTSEKLNNETAKQSIEDGSAILDFYGQSPRSSETVNVFMEDLGIASVTADMLITGNKAAVKKELESQSFENVSVEKGTAEFLGEDVPCLEISAVYAGYDFYERQVYIINGRNVASITAASFNNDTTQAILDIFTKN